MRIWIAIRMTLVLTLLTGIIYPVAMVGLAHLVFPSQAEGSLIVRNGRVIGSTLIGQNFLATCICGWKFRAVGENGHIIIGA